jgi:hypothetical protein
MHKDSYINILLIDIGGDEHTAEIPSLLKDKFRHSKIGAITSTKTGFVNKFDFFVDYQEIISGHFVDTDFVNGIGTDVYDLTKSCEIDAIRMMDRLPQFQHGYAGSLGDRRELFFQLSKFLHNFVTKNHVTHVIFANIPHEVYDFILYSLCKALSIPTLLFNDAGGVIKHSMTICESIEELGLLEFGSKVKRAISSVCTETWESDLESSFQRHDIVAGSSSKKSKITLKRLVSNAPITKKRRRLYLLKREYKNSLGPRRLPSRYILVALHVQPELSTSPCGGHFVEQIEAIKFLAANLDGYSILVREHPDQFRLRIPRTFGFYKAIAKIPGVVLSPFTIGVREVVSKSSAVVTVSGTIALESVLLGRPGFILGYSWFRQCPGIFKISNQKELASAVEALNNWKPIEAAQLAVFADSLKLSLFQGTTWGAPVELSEFEASVFRDVTVTNVSNIIEYWISNN